MFEIDRRTKVKNTDGDTVVLLPGRITDVEADLYGLSKSTRTTDKTSKKTPRRRRKSS